jgi:transcriptional regulator with XRE-family HTH domain
MYKQDMVERWFLGLPFKVADEEVGSTLKKLRTERGLSIKEVSEDTGFSTSSISRLENGKTSITIRNLIKLLDFYGVKMAEVFSSPVSKLVFRRDERREVESQENVRLEFLIDLKEAEVEPILANFTPGAQYREELKHGGVEFALVLKGEFRFELEDVDHVLHEGDCVYFSGEKAHGWQNLTDSDASVLMVITPPGF